MTALMDTEQHGIDHIINNLFFVSLTHRIGPDRSLLRSHSSRRICCYGSKIAVILLVRGRLDTVSGKQCIIHAKSSTGAVFNYQIRVACKYTIQPVKICFFMLQEALSHAFCTNLCTNSRLYIVVHFNIPYTIFLHHTVYDFIHMLYDCRVSKVQLISAAVIDSLSMAHKKPVIRCFFCLLTVNSHNLQFQPDTGNHSFFTDVICHFFDAIWKTVPAFLPFTNTVPPFSRCIPSGIDHIVFTATYCSCINKRKLLCSGRISKQTIHVIVKDYR